MNYELTQHARDVLQERNVPTEWVERVPANPARVEPSAISQSPGQLLEENKYVEEAAK